MKMIVFTLGKVFGKYTTIAVGPKSKHGHQRWWCQCTCGIKNLVDASSLRSGNSTQCKKCALAILSEKLRIPTPIFTCVNCGKQFRARPRATNNGYRPQKYCSRECTHPYTTMACMNCGTQFRKRFKKQSERGSSRLPKYCSNECYRVGIGNRIRTSWEDPNYRSKCSEIYRRRWAEDPDYRNKTIEGIRKAQTPILRSKRGSIFRRMWMLSQVGEILVSNADITHPTILPALWYWFYPPLNPSVVRLIKIHLNAKVAKTLIQQHGVKI